MNSHTQVDQDQNDITSSLSSSSKKKKKKKASQAVPLQKLYSEGNFSSVLNLAKMNFSELQYIVLEAHHHEHHYTRKALPLVIAKNFDLKCQDFENKIGILLTEPFYNQHLAEEKINNIKYLIDCLPYFSYFGLKKTIDQIVTQNQLGFLGIILLIAYATPKHYKEISFSPTANLHRYLYPLLIKSSSINLQNLDLLANELLDKTLELRRLQIRDTLIPLLDSYLKENVDGTTMSKALDVMAVTQDHGLLDYILAWITEARGNPDLTKQLSTYSSAIKIKLLQALKAEVGSKEKLFVSLISKVEYNINFFYCHPVQYDTSLTDKNKDKQIAYLSPLHIAAYFRDEDSTKVLLEKTKEINAPAEGASEAKENLADISNKISPITLPDTGMTPLHLACYQASASISRLYLNRSPNLIETKSINGFTAFDFTQAKNQTLTNQILSLTCWRTVLDTLTESAPNPKPVMLTTKDKLKHFLEKSAQNVDDNSLSKLANFLDSIEAKFDNNVLIQSSGIFSLLRKKSRIKEAPQELSLTANDIATIATHHNFAHGIYQLMLDKFAPHKKIDKSILTPKNDFLTMPLSPVATSTKTTDEIKEKPLETISSHQPKPITTRELKTLEIKKQKEEKRQERDAKLKKTAAKKERNISNSTSSPSRGLSAGSKEPGVSTLEPADKPRDDVRPESLTPSSAVTASVTDPLTQSTPTELDNLINRFTQTLTPFLHAQTYSLFSRPNSNEAKAETKVLIEIYRTTQGFK